MTDKDNQNDEQLRSAQDLRRRAQQAVSQAGVEDVAPVSLDEAKRVLHELRVHQIELELQNEELRHTQVVLDELRARYFDLYDLAPMGYLTLNEDGLILEANLRASTMLGVPRGELDRQPMTRFIGEDSQDHYYLRRKKLFETGEPQVCELRIKQPDGHSFWARLEATVVAPTPHGAGACRVAMSDITEQRTLQASLAQADRIASMGVLAAGVAHEINNPLTYVLYNIQTLAEDLPVMVGAVGRLRDALEGYAGDAAVAAAAGDDAQWINPPGLADLVDRAAHAFDGVQRIAAIARGLSSFSRVDQGELTMIDVNLAVEHSLKMCENEIRCRAVLHRDLGRVPAILGSPSKLGQIVVNLVVNAAHAIHEGDVAGNQISVRTWADTSHVWVEVTDTGHGISDENLEHIFEPFYTTKSPDRGTGLGLAITRRIVTELGGDIRVQSKVGEGTRVSVRFPAPAEVAEPRPPTPAVAVPGVRGRILVVDDDELVGSTLRGILGTAHDVVVVGSGRGAQELLGQDANFDLVLCDLMMPEVSGVDLHLWLQKHHLRLARQLVFITGGAFTPRTRDYLSSVSNLQITKPFDPAWLRQLVQERVAAARG